MQRTLRQFVCPDGIARISVESSGSRVAPLYDAFLVLASPDLDGSIASNTLRRLGICL